MRMLGAFIVLGSLLLAGTDYVAEFLAVDICLDAGHVYDYATSTCNKEAEHLRYASYAGRKGGLLALAVSGALAGLFVWGRAKTKKP